MPVAPTGCPPPNRPPLGLTGVRPPHSTRPSSMACIGQPGGPKPKWSRIMYSMTVKQSWHSMAFSSSTPCKPARAKASVMVPRTCGNM